MIKLTNRLSSIASLVREGERIVDVGCDHGYVPVWLVSQGISPSAVACDINESPLSSCRRLVADYRLESSITCVLSDGLDNIDDGAYDTIIIAGMGGELISDILSRCACVKEKRIILNPMTHPEHARKWLYDNGFDIEDDIIVADAGHHYSVLTASYSGNFAERTTLDYFLGNIKDYSDKDYFLHLLSYLTSKQKSGIDYSEIIKEIEKRL